MSPVKAKPERIPPDQADESAAQLQLDRYGVIVRNVKTYHWNGYQYGNARDALAAAKRGTAS